MNLTCLISQDVLSKTIHRPVQGKLFLQIATKNRLKFKNNKASKTVSFISISCTPEIHCDVKLIYIFLKLFTYQIDFMVSWSLGKVRNHVKHNICRKIDNLLERSSITYSLLILICYLFIINCSSYTQVATSFHAIFWKYVIAKVKNIETMTTHMGAEKLLFKKYCGKTTF